MELSPFCFGLYKLVKYLVYPFTWLSILVGLLSILTWVRVSPRRLRWMRGLALAAMFVIFILGLPVVAATLLGLVEQRAVRPDPLGRGPYEAIAVLPAGVQPRGSLRPATELTAQSLRRTICGARLFARGLAPRLLLMGGDASVFDSGPAEALELKTLALQLGVPDGAILVETRSRTTYESAVEARRLLGPAPILLVTSASHLPRAEALFRRQGMPVHGYPCGHVVRDRPGDLGHASLFDVLPNVGALGASTSAITELVGTLVYAVLGEAQPGTGARGRPGRPPRDQGAHVGRAGSAPRGQRIGAGTSLYTPPPWSTT